MPVRGTLLAALLALVAATAGVAQPISSPPPVAGRAASGTPLSETFSPDALFPKRVEPPHQPPPIDTGEVPPPPVKFWSGSADVGLNGASGNSDLFNLRGGWNVRRKTDANVFTSDFQYVLNEQSHVTKTHQALLNSRDEILFPDSRWSGFGAVQVEYDQLRAYRFRVGTYAGFGFQVWDEKDLVLKLRGGAGATRELGADGTPDRWVPEFLVGYDFRWRLTDRSSFVSILDGYPRIADPRQYRLRVRAAYECVLDPALGLIFRIGVQDRYDSDPGPAKRNDLTYFTTLGIKF